MTRFNNPFNEPSKAVLDILDTKLSNIGEQTKRKHKSKYEYKECKDCDYWDNGCTDGECCPALRGCM